MPDSLDDIDALCSLLHNLHVGVASIGELPVFALTDWAHRQTNSIVITAERRRHYLERHPEMSGYERELILTLLDPDAVHRYERDETIANLYRRIVNGRYIVATVWISNDRNLVNSLLTARISRRRARISGAGRGLEVWKR